LTVAAATALLAQIHRQPRAPLPPPRRARCCESARSARVARPGT